MHKIEFQGAILALKLQKKTKNKQTEITKKQTNRNLKLEQNPQLNRILRLQVTISTDTQTRTDSIIFKICSKWTILLSVSFFGRKPLACQLKYSSPPTKQVKAAKEEGKPLLKMCGM